MRTILYMICFGCLRSYGTGEPSTYFNIYIPPNNEIMGRDVCLIITALYDSTTFNIIDDGADGDTDDSKSGVLMQGQSYVLFLRNNGVNDDAPHSGESTTKQDGDYFTITADKLVFASQATLSGWQHDWLASFNKNAKGEKFIVYSNSTNGSSPNDINVFAYEDSTMVIVRKVSTSPLNGQGYTQVDMNGGTIVMQKMIGIGKDLINFYTAGRDLLAAGETFLIESNKPVTVQYGALYGYNERDGGGYVPSSNGSSAGSLFYFSVPYQAANEQEIRIVSWQDNTDILLERYTGSSWVTVQQYNNVQARRAVDWVGAQYQKTYPNVFRVTCTPGKKVSVLEANWMETGAPGTSDMATMASSDNGTSSGKHFLVYMPPPGNQNRITNPFTNTKLSQNTHAYLYATDSCTVYIKDAYTQGSKYNKTVHIAAGRYADVNLNLTEWKNIYNGTGSPSGPERPYLLIEATKNISVMISNSNDNWMMYFGSALEQKITQQSSCNKDYARPGDTVTVHTEIQLNSQQVSQPKIELHIGEGAVATDCRFKNHTTGTIRQGTIVCTKGKGTHIEIPSLPVTLDTTGLYSVETHIVLQPVTSDGKLVKDKDVVYVDMQLSGTVSGTFQQTSSSVGVSNEAANTSNYAFSIVGKDQFPADSVNTWNACWTDLNDDNYPDLFVPAYDKTKANLYYLNNKNGSFTRTLKGSITAPKNRSLVTAVFADVDNDGKTEALIPANIDQPATLHHKNAQQVYEEVPAGDFSTDKGYAQSICLADYDLDGYLDLFISEYFPTNFCRLYHNNGDGTFSRIQSGPLSAVSNYTNGSTWADYDDDGLPDLFIPVSGTSGSVLDQRNLLFHNEGNGHFSPVDTGVVVQNPGNATASCWGDYDNDGLPDLFVAQASNQKNMLYHNNGHGNFTRIMTGDIVNDAGDWHGCQWLDYDNDGWLDLYVLSNDATEWKRLYHNNGDGTFTTIRNEVVCAALANTISCSWADYDKNGFPDLYAATTGLMPDWLFKNNGNANHWISIRLKGTHSNASAIGAKILVKATIKGVPLWQMRAIEAGTGIGGQNALNACFGLADATVIDSLVIRWPSGLTQYHVGLNANQFIQIEEQSAGKLKGIVYRDDNSNCNADSTESGVRNVQLLIMPGGIKLNTDDEGHYAALLPAGQYTISLVASDYWNPACATSQLITIDSPGQEYTVVPLGVSAGQVGTDAYLEAGISAARRGFTHELALTYGNLGTSMLNGASLSITLPQGMYGLHADPMWQSAQQNVYTWVLADVASGGSGRILLTDSAGLSWQRGDSFSIIASVNNATDLNAANNTVTIRSIIVGAMDPNEIQVFPQGEGTAGYISQEQALHYTIHFENIGDYEAEHVRITYSIPKGLDVSKLKLEAASHSCHYILKNRELTIIFEHIKLPADSGRNLGFVTLNLEQEHGNAAGMVIPGQASIVFDYEEPLATNEVINTILGIQEDKKHMRLFLSPNPLRTGMTGLHTAEVQTDAYIEEINVWNASGQLLLQQKNIHQLTPYLSRNIFPVSGIYRVQARDLQGRIYTGSLVVE